MAPGHSIDEITILRSRLAELEAELEGLKRSEGNAQQRFRELLDAAPVMTWMSGPDAMCVFFNKAWLEFAVVSRKTKSGTAGRKGCIRTTGTCVWRPT